MFTNNQFIQKQNINNKLISNDNFLSKILFKIKFNYNNFISSVTMIIICTVNTNFDRIILV